ncbi:MAG: RNA polymerase sigma-70 factor, partial [Bacteroidetes bacterium]|nr:RNA polymerase sigma-70 factor [Bacteroidota bacterium]
MDNKQRSILQLFKLVSKEDLIAFEELYGLYFNRLLHFCITYINFKEPAEEIVSDVFVHVWTNRHTLGKILNPEIYLYVAVKNGALNYLKKNAGAKIISLPETGHGQLVMPLSPEEKLLQKELMYKLHLAVEQLPVQCKVIFTMVKEYGMKQKEVAEILGLSVRTVETQVFRAVKKLDSLLNDYISGTPPYKR